MRVHVSVQHGVLEKVSLLAGGLTPHATVHSHGVSSGLGGEGEEERGREGEVRWLALTKHPDEQVMHVHIQAPG